MAVQDHRKLKINDVLEAGMLDGVLRKYVCVVPLCQYGSLLSK